MSSVPSAVPAVVEISRNASSHAACRRGSVVCETEMKGSRQKRREPQGRSAIGGEWRESRVAAHRGVQRLDHGDRRGLSRLDQGGVLLLRQRKEGGLLINRHSHERSERGEVFAVPLCHLLGEVVEIDLDRKSTRLNSSH